MGMISSKFRKTENSGCDYWENIGVEGMTFMEEGGCMEPFMGYVGCSMEAKHKNEDALTKCKKANERLVKCFRANPDHFDPLWDIMEPVVTTVLNKIEALFPPAVSEEIDPIDVFMTGGACTESYEALSGCLTEVMDNNEDIAKCFKDYTMLMKCMDAHSNYYHPVLDVVREGQDLYLARFLSTMTDANINKI